jgi:hypothetical protein
MADRIRVGFSECNAALEMTGPDEVTAVLRHTRNAWDLITDAEPGTDAVIRAGGREADCTVVSRDLDDWTVTVAVTP